MSDQTLTAGNAVTVTNGSGSITVAVPSIFAGMIVACGNSSAPTGWLLCDGSAVSRTTYSSLFSAISTNYGSGDGVSTFNLPNLQQRFPLGKAGSGTGSTLGSTGGAIDHTHTIAAHTHTGPSHTHTIGDHTHTGPSHTHTIGDHTHTYSDVIAHTHSITDPGHLHTTFGDNVGITSGSDNYALRSSGSSNTSSSTTGISVNSTGISTGTTSLSGAGTTSASGTGTTSASGAGTTSASGTGTTSATALTSDSNNPPYVVVNYMIKT